MVANNAEGPTATMAALEAQTVRPVLANVSVAEFYSGKTVFITGGTGFMGKVLLEKLLRSCRGVYRIYLLIRPKKGQHSRERLQKLLSSPVFDVVRRERPNDLQKVLPIEGDITQPDLAISSNDRAMLQRAVNVVFHSAATVKFDEKLKLSVTINMLGTQRLVELCKWMTNLEALVHVSTAYCNCDRRIVKEIIYPPSISPDQVTSLVNTLDEKIIDSLTQQLVGSRPNTYTFTKALAECWLNENKGELPLVIVRPSIVLSCVEAPLKGWVDNFNGPTGIIAAAGKGLFRAMLCQPNKIADIVPVDMVINLMLVSAWRIGTHKTREIPLYNCVTGQRKPITWSYFIYTSFKYMRKHPFSNITWYPNGTVTGSVFYNTINRIFLHWLPAYILDTLVFIFGGKPILAKVQDKLCRGAKSLEYFTMHEWQFEDNNVKALTLLMSESDRREFCFDVTQINWEEYIENYILGIRKFIFKEDLDTLPKARRHMTRLYWLSRLLQILTVMMLWHFLVLRYAPLRKLWGHAFTIIMTVLRKVPFVK